MAQYDGSIRINTQIDTKDVPSQLMKLENSMQKVADKVTFLRSKMESLKDVKIPTQEYQEIQKQIEATEKKINDLLAHQEKFLATGGKKTSSTYKNMEYDLDELRNSLPYLQDELQSLVDTGKAFTFGSDTEQYAKLGQELQYAENNLVALNKRHDELTVKQGTVSERFSTMRAAAQKSFDAIRSGLFIIGSIGKKAFSGVLGIAKKAFSGMASSAKKAFSSITIGSNQSNASLSGGLKTILKYGFGIRSFYVLFNKIRTGIANGFKNLMGYSDSFANSVQSVKNSMSTLGNQISAAFAPIVQIIIPWLNALINALSTAMTYVAQFIAALTGANTFTKAKKVQDAYNKSLGGTAKAADKARGALAKFDDLDVLQKKEDETGFGGAGGGIGNLFEEVPISNKFKDLVQWLKEMWENSDFYELGKLLGEKLKEALDSIPWDEIKEIARKIGKSLATFINGFIEVEGLGESIGKTLVEALNTAFEFLNAFVHELHWDSLGEFISETINGFFQNIDWDLIYDTLVTSAKGFGDAINAFVNNLDWGAIATAISKFVNTIVDTIYEFITTTDWIAIAENLGKTLSDAFTGIDWTKFGETVSEAFKTFFDFITTTIESIDWWAVGESVRDFLVGIDWAGVADSFFEAVGAAFGGLAAFIGGLIADGVEEAKQYFQDKIEEAGGNVVLGILKGIGDAIAGIAEWIYEHIFVPFIDGFKEAFGIHSPSTVMTEMGGYLIEGLINGIKDMWNSLKDTISEIGKGVIDKFKEILDIHSPSKKTEELGNYTIEGYINGLENKASHVSDIWTLIKEQTISILQSLADWISNFGLSISDGLVATLQGIQEQFTLAWTSLYESTVETWTMIQEYFTEFWLLFIESLIETWEEILLIFTENFEQVQFLFEEFITFLNEIFLVSWIETWTMAGQQYQTFNDLLTALTNAVQTMLALFMKQIEMLINTTWKSSWKNAENIFSEFKGKVQEICGDVREIVQSLFDFVMSLVAEMLAGIESVSSAAASISAGGFGGGGGASFGGYSVAPAMTYSLFNDVPRLASGSVIRGGNPFMAILGDQKVGQTNVEAPAGLIKDMVAQGIAESGIGRESVPVTINLNWDGETFARLSISDILSELARQGYDVDVLGVT